MLEHLDTLAETAAKAISNIKFDKVIVWEGGNGSSATSGFLQNIARSLPPMMQVIKDIGGVELPDYLGRLAADGGKEGDGRSEVPMEVPIVAAHGGVAAAVETVAAPKPASAAG